MTRDFDDGPGAPAPGAADDGRAPGRPAVLPLVAEEVHVAKRDVVTGRVTVRTLTDTVDEVVRSTLRDESVEVTRTPVDREVAAAPAIRTEGDTTIVPVVEEVLVVEKRLVLKEEIRIRRVSRTEAVETTVPLRRQRAVVERHDAGATAHDPSPQAPSPEEREQ